MKRAIVLLSALLLSPLAGMAAVEPSQPNIILFLFDDMGYGQPQCYNPQSALRTPNLDRLATQGMRFTDAHSASSVCTPTRYGVMTGRYPSRLGQFGVLSSTSRPIIPTTRMTVASMLKGQGYATACIGKWHLGMNWVEKTGDLAVEDRMTGGPLALGFDLFFGYTEARSIATVIEQDRVVTHLNHEYQNQPLMIKKAVEWIGQQKPEQPFFLYFPVCPPHEPVVPAPDYVGQSNAKDVVKKNPKYGDWVYQGDAMLGQIMQALDKNHFSDNTMLMVSADNGAAGRDYAPLRDSKASIYEGGHRVPCVVRWPGKVKPGSTWGHTICLNDFMATAAEITGVNIPSDAAEDSVSILPALLGTSDAPTREATVHQSHAGDLAIRQGPWKAIFLTDGKRELYNLADDVGEQHDVLADNPEVMTQLTALFQQYIDNGRSTPGEVRKNEYAISLEARSGGKNPKRKAKPSQVDNN
jgi:arylsulfatase A